MRYKIENSISVNPKMACPASLKWSAAAVPLVLKLYKIDSSKNSLQIAGYFTLLPYGGYFYIWHLKLQNSGAPPICKLS